MFLLFFVVFTNVTSDLSILLAQFFVKINTELNNIYIYIYIVGLDIYIVYIYIG